MYNLGNFSNNKNGSDKMKTKTIFIIILLMLLGSCTGIILYKTVNKKKVEKSAILANREKTSMNTDIVETSAGEELKISPNASLIKKTEYRDCGHTKVEVEYVPEEVVNFNETEFRKKYDEWEVESFKNNEIKLYKVEIGSCGEHFLIKDNNGYVSIFNIDENGNEILVENTNIATEYLPEADYHNVKKGIEVVGMQELNSKLEDFE